MSIALSLGCEDRLSGKVLYSAIFMMRFHAPEAEPTTVKERENNPHNYAVKMTAALMWVCLYTKYARMIGDIKLSELICNVPIQIQRCTHNIVLIKRFGYNNFHRYLFSHYYFAMGYYVVDYTLTCSCLLKLRCYICSNCSEVCPENINGPSFVKCCHLNVSWIPYFRTKM